MASEKQYENSCLKIANKGDHIMEKISHFVFFAKDISGAALIFALIVLLFFSIALKVALSEIEDLLR
jgi:hypothetical protein